MPPIMIHQEKEYTHNLHLNVPLEWIAHHIPYGYMDRDGCIKSTTQLSTVYSASPINNQIILFGWNYIHFDDCAHSYLEYQNIQPFVMVHIKNTNDHPNKNGTN